MKENNQLILYSQITIPKIIPSVFDSNVKLIKMNMSRLESRCKESRKLTKKLIFSHFCIY